MTSQPASALSPAAESPAPVLPGRPEPAPTPGPNGSPSRSPSHPSRARGWTTRGKLLVARAAVAGLAVLGVGLLYAFAWHSLRGARTDLVTYRVHYDRLEL